MSLIELVGWSLVHSLWEGVVLALALFVVLRLAHQRRAVLRYGSAILALFLALVLPPVTALRMDAGPAAVAPLAPRTLSSGNAVTPQSRTVATREQAETAENSPLPQTAPTQDRAIGSVRSGVRSALPWVVGCWIFGVLLLSIRLFTAWLRARALRIDGTSAAPEAFQRAVDLLVIKLGVLRPVRVLQSTIVQVPAVIGWLRPVVLIPATLINGLTVPQLEAILAHELAHIRRHDYLVNLLQALVETLLFYHPGVWWISRQVRQEREHCCDDVAVRVCGDRKLYAGALLSLEEHRAMALLPAATGGDLLSRIRRIASPRLNHVETSPRWAAAIIAVGSVVTVGAGSSMIDFKGTPAREGKVPYFAEQDAAASPDTVIRHPNPAAPLAERYEWAQQLAATQRYRAFWIGYTIEPMPGIEGSIYMGRLERRGVTGAGGLNLRGRIVNFGNFEGFHVPGVMLSPLVGGGMPDDVAMLFAFVPDARGRPVLARVHVSSLALPVDLEDRPLLWLGNATDEQSIQVVEKLYDMAPADLKRDVVAAVGVHGSSLAVTHLSRWLTQGDNNDVREEAAEWLGRHPDPAALALLTRAARGDRVSDIRREAAEAVSEMRLPAATDSLIDLAKSLQDRDARQEAVEGLAERRDARAMAATLEIARNDPDTDIRREAVETLGEFPDGAGVPHLIELARTDPSSDIRQEAVETLAEAGSPQQVIGVLRKVVEEDQDEDVAREAVETLGEVDDPQVPRILRELARNHPRPEVRKEAIETLSEMAPGAETVALLSELARNEQNEEVQDEAIESLSEMGDPEASRVVSEVARKHQNTEVRRNAVEMLTETLKPLDALEQLKTIVREDPSEEVQVEAVETLGELPPEHSIPALTEIVRTHPSEAVRMEALETLGELEGASAVEVLTAVATGDASAEVQEEAVETLSELDGGAGVPSLIRIARDHPNREVRAKALSALGESDDPRAREAIQRMLQ